jgi:hypothetical protein
LLSKGEIPMKKLLTLAILALALAAGTVGVITLNSAPAQASCGGENC